jgi:hypothetical protein
VTDDVGLPQAVTARIRALEAIARTTSPDDLRRLGPAVDALRDRKDSFTQAFWTGDAAGMSFSVVENDAFAKLWTRMLAGLAFALSGHDVEEHVVRAGIMGRLDRLVQPRPDSRIEGAATAILEGALGGSVWNGALEMWNAFCAALIQERLDPTFLQALEAPWRAAAIGPTPRESIAAP